VVDDDPNHCGFVREVLTHAGFIVMIADNGARCLEILGTVTPDLIMLDITMPGMNGWDVARAVRAQGLDEVMILMVSAEAKELTAPPRDDPPHDDYLIKPFNLSDLFERLETLLDLDWIREAAEEPHGR
jgi:DNA-binding response OmpR family regulator